MHIYSVMDRNRDIACNEPSYVFFSISAENPKMRNRCSALPADMFSLYKEEADEFHRPFALGSLSILFGLHDIVNRSEKEIRVDWVAPPKKNMMRK